MGLVGTEIKEVLLQFYQWILIGSFPANDRAWFVHIYGEIIHRRTNHALSMISSVDLACNGVSRAKYIWVYRDCARKSKKRFVSFTVND